MSARCTGHCCYGFHLRVGDSAISPEAVRALGDDDSAFVADMVVPILGPLEEGKLPSYACEHFDGRNCLAYESRPRVCRDHGMTESPCTFRGCTLKLTLLRTGRSRERRP